MTEQEKNSEALHQLGVDVPDGFEFDDSSEGDHASHEIFRVLKLRKIPIYREPVKQDMGKIAEFRGYPTSDWIKGQFLTIDSDGLFVFKHEGAVGFYNHARIKD